MTISIEQITEVTDHPNADRLSVVKVGDKTTVSSKVQEDGKYYHRYVPDQWVVFVPAGIAVRMELLKDGWWDADKDRPVLGGELGNVVEKRTIRGVEAEGIIFIQRDIESMSGIYLNKRIDVEPIIIYRGEYTPRAYTHEELEEHRNKWVEALESGRYTQAKGMLKSSLSGGMCCLGVACDLSGLGSYENYGNGETTYIIPGLDAEHGGFQDGTAPEPVMEWLGLTTRVGAYYNEEGEKCSLTEDNDRRHHDFKRIAATIRSKPPGLFVE